MENWPKRLALTCALILLASGADAQTSSVVETRPPTDLRRVTIVVEDVDRSLKLYRDALGMRVSYDAHLNTTGPALARGAESRPARLAVLTTNDARTGGIGLFQYLDPPLTRAAPVRRSLELGSFVLVVSVADACAACSAAAAAPGVSVALPVAEQTFPGRSGAPPVRVRKCEIWDADGAFLEISQSLSQSARSN